MFRAFTLICILFFVQQLQAQTLRVERISIKEGLSQGYVPDQLQDQEGFIWIGTKNGLNRYDGREFLQFTHDPEIPNSMSDDHVWALKECGDFLLIATKAGVLDFYHKKSRRFFHLPLMKGNTLSAPYTQKIFLDAQQQIWLVTGEYRGLHQICFIRLPNGFWENLAANTESITSLKPEFIPTEKVSSAVLSLDRNTLFFNSDNGFYALDTRSLERKAIHWPASLRPVNLHLDPEGKIWCATGNWMSCYDGTTYQDFMLDFPAEQFQGVLRSNHALIASGGELMAISTSKIKTAGRISKSMADWKIPCSDAILSQMEDSNGNIWFGQNGKGILKVNPSFRQVLHLFAGNSVYGTVSCEPGGIISAVLPTKILVYPENSRSSTERVARQSQAKVLGHWRHTTDKSGNQWLLAAGDQQAQLVKTAADGTQKFFEIPGSFRTPGNLIADDAGFVWLASERRLLQFDTRTESLKNHSLESVFAINPEIFCLQKTPDGTLWIGSQAGLLEAKPDGQGSFYYKLYTVETGNLRNNVVSSLLLDPLNPQVLWIASKGGGLARLDLATRQFSHFYSRNGLPNDVLYGILPDTQGNLWMSSNKGIIRYTPATGAIRNFTEADGLQSDEFNTWAYAPGQNGTLMFGGINGLNVFSPESFSDNTHLPAVFLTGLSINNKPVGVGDSTGVLPEAIEFLKKVELSFEQRSITLSFAALEFTASVKNRFRWILEGAETSWHTETMERSATYLNLQPGSYTFKVMAANGDGVWNPTPATLKIEVLPPWYRTIWAYLIYAAMIGGLIYGYLRFRISQLRLQQELALEQLNAERLTELDKFKSQVFTNVSHEFRTPLTVILGMAEQLENQVASNGQTQSAVTLIKRSGQNLLRLINQILDLAKLENNSLKINYIQGDVLAFVRYAAESMQSLASMKNVLLRVESNVAEGKIVMDYDPERLLHILHNLLSNAIKFTDAGGRVSLRVSTSERRSGDATTRNGVPGYLLLSVSDTGAGIPTDQLPHIFDRFFQADNQENINVGGSGIGLSLTQELVKLMDGEISVESELGKGTVFSVRLPIRNTAIIENENTDQIQSLLRVVVPAPHAPNAQIPQLLLIEDNPDVVEYLSVCLGEHYRLDYAYNGRSGIERALETIPDLIISDVMMPEKDGFEVCETLKNDERSSHIPLVLLTAKVGVEDRIAGLRRGADAYLAKPFHPDELRAVLANLLEMRQKLQAKYAGMVSGGVVTGDRSIGGLVSGGLVTGDRESGTPIDQSPIHQSPINQSPIHQSPPPDPEDAFILKLRTAVEAHLSEADLSVEDISRMVGMSYPVVHRKVTALTGRSLTLYVRAIRLQKAQALLADPSLSISEVAYQTGFNDPKFFSRVFSEEFGMPPTAWRLSGGA
jgi:signal transduction histidine kinase/ligand-binding sensor domain-containing protein/AraC-like DNA-binding protein/ActR/RegA family two-component response regulator